MKNIVLAVCFGSALLFSGISSAATYAVDIAEVKNGIRAMAIPIRRWPRGEVISYISWVCVWEYKIKKYKVSVVSAKTEVEATQKALVKKIKLK